MRVGLRASQFPFLERLSRAGRDDLAALAATRVPANEHLLRRGEPAQGAYLVTGGALRVYYISPEGREATLYHIEPGGTCILALSATFNDEPYPAWVDAGPHGSELTCVPAATCARLLDTESAFRSYVFAVMSGRVFELMRTLEEVGSSQLEQRVARYLLRQRSVSDGTVRITQVGLAADLGTAREVVFRALRSLAARQLIETGRKRIRVLDPTGLAQAAGIALASAEPKPR
jgi:CRP/FNR family transcriptional regulator